jgi:hypothetical protein
MRKWALRLLVLGAGLGLIGLATPASARMPVVAELFTAQGCSSCVDAGALISDLADDPRVIALTFAVDYWDYLGWADTFAQPAFAERQRAYMTRFAQREVYTPQLVVDGRFQTAALPASNAVALVRQAKKSPHDPPDVAFRSGNRVLVGAGRSGHGGADVWLVRYDPAEQKVAVKAGENRGQTIVARNVVRQLVRLGSWTGRPRAYRLPLPVADGLNTVVIVQGVHGGRIIAAKAS